MSKSLYSSKWVSCISRTAPPFLYKPSVSNYISSMGYINSLLRKENIQLASLPNVGISHVVTVVLWDSSLHRWSAWSQQRKQTAVHKPGHWNLLSCSREWCFYAQFTPKSLPRQVSRNTKRYWWKISKDRHKSVFSSFSALQDSKLIASFPPPGVNCF